MSLCGVLGRGTYTAEPLTRVGLEGHRWFLAAGSRYSVTGWANADPAPAGQDMLWGSVRSSLGTATPMVRTSHSCVPPPVQALQQLQGPGEHSPTSKEVGKEEMAPGLMPKLLSKETPASVLEEAYGSHTTQLLQQNHPFSQQVRSALSPWLQHRCPCTKAWGMACAVEAAPAPALPALPRDGSTRYGRQMRVWHRLTSSEGSGMSGAPCPPAWPSKAEEGLKVRSLCGWLLEAAGGGCRDCWVGGPLWCNGCPDWLLGWGTCKPCCMEVWDWSVLPGWGICGGGKKQEKKVRPQGTVLAVPDSVTACYKTK